MEEPSREKWEVEFYDDFCFGIPRIVEFDSRRTLRASNQIEALRAATRPASRGHVGGKLSLVVELPDRPPVILTGRGGDERKSARKRTKSTPKSGVKSKPKSRRAA
jgi:hypothetical protein